MASNASGSPARGGRYNACAHLGVGVVGRAAVTQQRMDQAQFAARFRLGAAAGDTAPLPLRPELRSGPLPLPMRVELFWQRQQYRADVPMHLHTLRCIEGQPDLGAIEDSVAALMQRHESLRTRLALCDGVPCQQIHPRVPLPVEQVDLRALPPGAVATQAAAAAAEFITRPLDLLSGPTCRVLVMRPDDGHFILGLVLHHYFGDARSMELLTSELLQLYACALRRVALSLPAVAHQYADYAAWQRQLALARSAEYIANLRRQLRVGEADAPAASRGAYLAGGADAGRSGGLSIRVGGALASQVNSRARSLDLSPAPLLLAAHQDAVRRWSGRVHAATAVPFAARTRAEFARTAGYLINAMPVPAPDAEATDLAARAGRIRRSMLNALLWQDLSYELLEDCVCAVPPLCHTMFNFIPLHVSGGPQEIGGLRVSEWQPQDLTARIAGRSQVRVMEDFVCYLRELPGDFACDLLYNADRFQEADLREYADCYRGCLQALCAS